MSKDYLFDTVNEIALQFVGIFQVFVFDSFLALGAFVPSYFGAFVTADMEEFAGKQRNDFFENVWRQYQDNRNIY